MFDKIIIDCFNINSITTLRDNLCTIISPELKKHKKIIFLCIGTDRSTGDSLGPLVGDKLKFIKRNDFYIYGNLENPIHAKNLSSEMKNINQTFKDPFIIAIDASLGNIQNVGSVIIEDKPLSPGAALNKNLPPVGDICITGIVNISGSLEFMVLQNTRLFTVMKIADVIAKGIYHSILKCAGTKHNSKKNNGNYLEENLIEEFFN